MSAFISSHVLCESLGDSSASVHTQAMLPASFQESFLPATIHVGSSHDSILVGRTWLLCDNIHPCLSNTIWPAVIIHNQDNVNNLNTFRSHRLATKPFSHKVITHIPAKMAYVQHTLLPQRSVVAEVLWLYCRREEALSSSHRVAAGGTRPDND